MSLREKILAATASFRMSSIEIPELGGKIHIRPLSLAGMARVQAAIARKEAASPGEAARIAQLELPTIYIVDCLCDDKGARAFTADDEAMIGDLPSDVVAKLVEAITDHSKLAEAKGDEAAGN